MPTGASAQLLADRGAYLVNGVGGCSNCHSGPNFSNGELRDNGFSIYAAKNRPDAGKNGERQQMAEQQVRHGRNGTPQVYAEPRARSGCDAHRRTVGHLRTGGGRDLRAGCAVLDGDGHR